MTGFGVSVLTIARSTAGFTGATTVEVLLNKLGSGSLPATVAVLVIRTNDAQPDRGYERYRGRSSRREIADHVGECTQSGVVRAGRGGNEGQARREYVGDVDAGRVRGAIVRGRQRIGHVLTRRDRAGRFCLDYGQVGRGVDRRGDGRSIVFQIADRGRLPEITAVLDTEPVKPAATATTTVNCWRRERPDCRSRRSTYP